jgi:SAM-dependent methyltransferase
MSEPASLPDAYFESMYRRDGDPWRFASSDYERDKYAATLAAIGDGKIGAAFEVGCSIGVFTHALAERCAHVLAVDVSDTALAAARARCADWTNVDISRLRIPGEWPGSERFDLIVLSEVLYFLSPADVDATARQARAALQPRGKIVLVNWTGATDYPQSGDAAAERFIAGCELTMKVSLHQRRPAYRLDVLKRLSALRREGDYLHRQ